MDQPVGDVGTVILGRVDVVDAELDGTPQNAERGVAIRRRAEHTGARQLHRPEADAAHCAAR